MNQIQAIAEQHPLLVLILLIWTIAWKGVALWMAARRKDQTWFFWLLIVNTLGIVEIVYIYIFAKKKPEV